MKNEPTIVQADLLEPLINGKEDSSKISTTTTPTTMDGHLVSGEDTPAYAVLQAYGLLNGTFRRNAFEDIFDEHDLQPNATHSDIYNNALSWHWYSTGFCGVLFQYQPFTVPPGCVVGYVDDDNNYLLAKPGSHLIKSPFIKRKTGALQVTAGRPIIHGNRTVVTVPQG